MNRDEHAARSRPPTPVLWVAPFKLRKQPYDSDHNQRDAGHRMQGRLISVKSRDGTQPAFDAERQG